MQQNALKYRQLGIHTQHEHFAYMREDCHVCISEGFEALTRINVSDGKRTIVASLNIISSDILEPGEIGLSQKAEKELGISEGDELVVTHLEPVNSLRHIRSKIYGSELSYEQFDEIINDTVQGELSNVHLSAFITACGGNRMSTEEIINLTKAMIKSGEHISWKEKIIVDKHCIGGLPGNRTTPIIVSIVAAFGLKMPKTSSRAITSPAGTADTMETLTNVNLSLSQIKETVAKTNGCLAWGGVANLSPADDILIRIERALDIDSEGQLIASVLSKKVAAGSSYVVIDVPVGETAKLRSIDAATALKIEMEKVAHAIGLHLKVVITDGEQPVGRGIGPGLEARDVMAVLQNEEDAPVDLKERSLLLAGELLELSGKIEPGDGNDTARRILESGKALEKFKEICNAQGAFKSPPDAKHTHEVEASNSGVVTRVDNRKLAKIAKLAGAPEDKSAGIDMYVKLESIVKKGDVVFVVQSETKGELLYALEYLNNQCNIITIQ